MTQTSADGESFRQVVRAIFTERFGPDASMLDQAVDEPFCAAVAAAHPNLPADRAYDLAFHLSDWRADAAFLVALSIAPERFTRAEVEAGLAAFLVHAPNHVAAAAKLSGWPVADIFELGALDGDHRQAT